ncbi:MAG: iron ABC transporter permease [Desulfobacterota bacterium]|nr:iron ABC transporter permease [Thermodesulfobacteriota bacterium]
MVFSDNRQKIPLNVLRPKKVISICAILTLLLMAIVLTSVMVGSVKLDPRRSLSILVESFWGRPGEGTETEAAILLSIRLPRVLLAAGVGAGLSLSGAIFQALLRNPLADPYILGVSSGSAVGAILAILLGWGSLSFGLPLASFAGAVLTIGLVFQFGKQDGRIHPNTLLLAGVITGSFLSALIMFFLSISQREELRTIVFWLMGDFSFTHPRSPLIILPYLAIGFFILYRRSRQLNLILSGEESALQLGVEVERLKVISYLCASLITAASVSLCGLIGFVGLIIPHATRLLFGPDHRLLLPASGLIGASYLILCDTLARTILSPVELPVGVITAAFGGPFFLYLLRRSVGVRPL